MSIADTAGLGRIEIVTLPLPDDVQLFSATYTFSGSVLVFYRLDGDPQERDYYRIAVVNDDGGGWRPIFAGLIPQHAKANGIRHMPFADNRRVLLGDHVLECAPDIDRCEQTTLVPIHYPWLLDRDPRTLKHWSEIIIAPDNEHIAWTMLRHDYGAAVVMGRLKRTRRRYSIINPQVISSPAMLEPDPARPGYVRPLLIRGGEVKQFVYGGAAISLVGAKDGYVTDSVVQDLASCDLAQITHTPGYDETTIFSPDERLGLVMSTRGSPHTDPAIFGLLPRPHGRFATQGLIMFLYLYAVAGVRTFRPGNIGPVLIDITRSMNEPGYRGVLLHDPEERWVYVSPMSWHPNGKSAMWLETLRGSESATGYRLLRIRRALLHDYQPRPTVATQRTPEIAPYGLKGLRGALSLWLPFKGITTGKIAGRHSGSVEIRRPTSGQALANTVELHYQQLSDDGQTFFNGFERTTFSLDTGCQYKALLKMTGAQQGEIKLRVEFSGMATGLPRLLFEPAADGQPKSHGYATYNGVTLRIEDLVE